MGESTVYYHYIFPPELLEDLDKMRGTICFDSKPMPDGFMTKHQAHADNWIENYFIPTCDKILKFMDLPNDNGWMVYISGHPFKCISKVETAYPSEFGLIP